MSPNELLEHLHEVISQGGWPSRQEVRMLVRLCTHPTRGVREAALTLLLAPPVTDELQHHERLVASMVDSGVPIGDVPEPVVQLILERIALLGETPPGEKKSFHSRLLRNLLQTQLELFQRKRISVNPFIGFLPPGKMVRKASPEFRRNWRLILKKLNSQSNEPPWARVSTVDIALLVRSRKRRSDHTGLVRGTARIRACGRAIALPAGQIGAAEYYLSGNTCSNIPDAFRQAPPPLHQCYWGGWGKKTLCRFEHLIRLQAEELRAVRELALQISEATGRVVLSLHNASLAAAGGWAFDSLSRFFTSEGHWEDFCRAVRKRALTMAGNGRSLAAEPAPTFAVWEKRVILPRLAHALWESRIRAVFDPSRKSQWLKDLEAAEPFLDPSSIEDIVNGHKLCWHGMVSPHQTVCVRDVLAYRESREMVWTHGLERLAALVAQGQSLLDRGELQRFVLPWIDKFFISSRGEGDLDFLPSVVEWLEGRGLHPLILFFEDTSRSMTPTFGEVLKRLVKRGHQYRGIGIFGEGRFERERAREIILDEHEAVQLFALRPFTDVHHQVPLKHILFSDGSRFPEVYDSSWKDDLSFIYTGTQIWPLLSVQCTPEPFPPWVGVFHRKLPFGSWFRNRLRNLVLGPDAARMMDQFSLEYGVWANLF